MRLLTLFLSLLLVSLSAQAVEPINDQQVMLYYTIPLGTVSNKESQHQFGLRLDRVSHSPYDTVQITTLQKRPAAFNLTMSYHGLESLDINGQDYAAYLVAKAAEGEADTPAATESADKGSADAGASGEDKTAATDKEKEKPQEPSKFDTTVKDLPIGVFAGVIIAVGLLVGAGN